MLTPSGWDGVGFGVGGYADTFRRGWDGCWGRSVWIQTSGGDGVYVGVGVCGSRPQEGMGCMLG